MVCFTLLHSQTTTDETLEPRIWEAEGALGKLLTLGREWLFSLVPHVISKIDRVQLPVCKWSEPVVNGLYCLVFRVLVCHALLRLHFRMPCWSKLICLRMSLQFRLRPPLSFPQFDNNEE